MEAQNYTSIIDVNASAAAAVNGISNVIDWWGEDVEGSAKNQGDVFTIRFGSTYVIFKVIELIPEKKIVWLVTDSHLPWLHDKTEWTGTKVMFEIESKDGSTQISMTHVGLTPEVECYTQCEKGWDFYIKQSLPGLLNEGQGMPDRKRKVAQ